MALENSRFLALAGRHGYREIGLSPVPEGWNGPKFIEFEREKPAVVKL